MIGAKTIASAALLAAGTAAAVMLLNPARIAGLDATALFWIGLGASVAGPLVVRFWRLHQRSGRGFVYARDDEAWESEADFLRLGRHRIAVADSEGEASDLPAFVQYAIYIGLAFVVGLLTIDGRALAIIAALPSEARLAGSRSCPDPAAVQASKPAETPGCALLRRAFELGYAKDLGPCAAQEQTAEQAFCDLRHHDEPALHYAWRLLDSSWVELRRRLEIDYLAELEQSFADHAAELETLAAAPARLTGTGPRASHQIWTNLPNPRGGLRDEADELLNPGGCGERFRQMPHRPRFGGTRDASILFEHVLGKLLFEPRYAAPAGNCREYTLHWDAPDDTCARLVADPEPTLADSGTLTEVAAILERFDLTRRQAGETKSAAARTSETAARRLQQYLSFSCFMVEPRPAPARRSMQTTLAGRSLPVAELRVNTVDNPERTQIDWYRDIAALLARGFHYSGLMSEASVIPGAETDAGESLFAGGDHTLARLDFLADMDIFLGHRWILAREDLRDLYPYHLHLKNFVELFRRQYRAERGRL